MGPTGLLTSLTPPSLSSSPAPHHLQGNGGTCPVIRPDRRVESHLPLSSCCFDGREVIPGHRWWCWTQGATPLCLPVPSLLGVLFIDEPSGPLFLSALPELWATAGGKLCSHVVGMWMGSPGSYFFRQNLFLEGVDCTLLLITWKLLGPRWCSWTAENKHKSQSVRTPLLGLNMTEGQGYRASHR